MEAAAAPRGRKIETGRVINESFDHYKDQFGPLIGLSVIVFGISGLIQGLLYDAGALGQLIGTLVSLIAVALYTGFVVRLVEDVRDGRRDFTVNELISSAAPAIGPLIVNSILRGIAVGIGFFLLIVPGLILLTIWAVTSPAIVVERKGVIGAFGRSRELVKGNGWPVFGAILIAFLITFGVNVIATAIGVGLGTAGLVILTILATVATAPIGALVASVLFFDLGGDSAAGTTPEPASSAPPAPPAVG